MFHRILLMLLVVTVILIGVQVRLLELDLADGILEIHHQSQEITELQQEALYNRSLVETLTELLSQKK